MPSLLSSTRDIAKKHWRAILAAIILVMMTTVIAVCYGWIRRQQAGFANTLADLNASHQIEIDQITKARADEKKQHEVELKQLQDNLSKIQADYAAAQITLAQQQTQEQRDIVKKYNNDADGLAQLLADRMGFVVVKSQSR